MLLRAAVWRICYLSVITVFDGHIWIWTKHVIVFCMASLRGNGCAADTVAAEIIFVAVYLIVFNR